MNNSQKKIFIISGEASGDLHASELVRKILDRNNKINFFGIGGNNLKKAGVNLLFDYNVVNYIGIFSIIKNYFSIRNYIYKTVRKIKELKPDIVILVDFPGFNLKIAKIIKKFYNGKIVYYISPQIWAWHKSRIKIIKNFVDKMLVIFPFEVEFYAKEGVNVSYVGHPLKDKISEFLAKNKKLSFDKFRITLLPGSRLEEIRNILPILIKTAQILKDNTNAEINIICAQNIDKEIIESMVPVNSFNIIVNDDNNENINYKTILNSDLVFAKSGTSTLECCLLETPLCVVYNTNLLNYYILRSLIKVKYLSIVNILAGREIVKEYLQKDFKVNNLLLEGNKILNEPDYRNKLINNLKEVKNNLFEFEITKDASAIIFELLV